MTDYKELYLKMFRAPKAAVRLLVETQQECEELYLSSQDQRKSKVILIKKETDEP